MLQFRRSMHGSRRGHSCIRAFVRSCICAFSCLLASPLAAIAQQNERARAEALAARAGERLDALHREADRLAAQERTLLGDLRQLELDRQIKLEERRRLDDEASDVERERLTISERLETLQADESTSRPDLEARLVEIYKLGQARYARLLLSTSDLRRIGQAARTAAVLAQIDRDRIASHQRLLTELQSSRAALEERGRRLEKLRADARRAEAEVVRAAQARTDAIASIDQQRDLNARLAGELLAAQQQLQVELRTLARGQASASSAAAQLPVELLQADLDWPTAGAVRRPFEKPQPGRPAASNGIEIVAVEGADVTAVHDGVVRFADSFSGFGNLVIVDHGAQAFSLYGNLLDISVKKGARVTAGQPVGTVGASLSGLASLYFEMRVDGQPVDPLQWLKKR
jgi:murein hydrolase activator